MSNKLDDVRVKQQNAIKPSPNELGINIDKPKFPQYAVYSKRLDSFDEWPEYLTIRKEDMVEAGLVYTGVGDSVRCYFCGGGLRNWELGDVPMVEHARWYPKCPHILLVKGQEYVEKVCKGEKLSDKADGQSKKGCYKSINHMETLAAQSCIDMGYSKEMVAQAIKIFIRKHKNSDFKGKDLCEILFEIEENPEEHEENNGNEERKPVVNLTTDEDNEQIEPIGTLLEENQKLKETQRCKICLDKRADILLLPCGHMVTCAMCAPALIKCPVCRQKVNGLLKAYFSVIKNNQECNIAEKDPV